MPKKYILNHKSLYHEQGTKFFEGGSKTLVPENGGIVLCVDEIKDFDYWFTEVKEESPEEIIARLTKEVEELRAMCIGQFRYKHGFETRFQRCIVCKGQCQGHTVTARGSGIEEDKHDNNSC